MKNFKILGQEPAFLVGVVEAVLMMLLTFGVSGLSQETVGVVVAAVAAGLGLVTAYATKTTLYSALIGFAKATLVLAVTFGAPLSDAQTGSIIAVVVLVAGAYLREKTSSVETAVSEASPGAVADVQVFNGTYFDGVPIGGGQVVSNEQDEYLFGGPDVSDGTKSPNEFR